MLYLQVFVNISPNLNLDIFNEKEKQEGEKKNTFPQIVGTSLTTLLLPSFKTYLNIYTQSLYTCMRFLFVTYEKLYLAVLKFHREVQVIQCPRPTYGIALSQVYIFLIPGVNSNQQ